MTFGALVRVFQDDGEAADPFDQRDHICLTKPLFEQHQITLPMPELTTVRHDL